MGRRKSICVSSTLSTLTSNNRLQAHGSAAFALILVASRRKFLVGSHVDLVVQADLSPQEQIVL
jgi:hypothetical protein